MKYVVEREESPKIYAGYYDGVPTWTYHRGKGTQFERDLAERVVSQLTGLGFQVEVKELLGVKERRRGK